MVRVVSATYKSNALAWGSSITPQANKKSATKEMQSRAWCYTVNNYSEAEIEAVKAFPADKVLVHICAKEVGESGTPHLQGYVRFDKNQRSSAMKKLLPRAHIERRHGSEKQAFDYCKKGGEIVVEIGEPSEREEFPTRDSEAKAILHKINEGTTWNRLMEEHPVFTFWHRRPIWDRMHDVRRMKRDRDAESEAYHMRFPDEDPQAQEAKRQREENQRDQAIKANRPKIM